MLRFAATICLAFGCARAKPEEPKQDPGPDVVAQWHGAQDRLTASFAPDGFVVSIEHGDGFTKPRNQGDSLIGTGVALASMDCARGAALDKALQDMVRTLNGGLWRHPGLPDQISLDGALGFYLGVAHRITHCGGADAWRPLLTKHLAMAPALNPAGFLLDDPFTAVRDAVLSLVGLAPYPGADQLHHLGEAAAAMAAAPGAARAWNQAHPDGPKASEACYRAHLGLISLQVIEVTGGAISQTDRDAFCQFVAPYNLPTSDHFCGRGDLRGWAASFQNDQYQFRHQRCPKWEQPDGDGLWQPAVDLIRGLADAYAFQF